MLCSHLVFYTVFTGHASRLELIHTKQQNVKPAQEMPNHMIHIVILCSEFSFPVSLRLESVR